MDPLQKPPAYYYEGIANGAQLRLPRTHQAEAAARDLMQELATDPRYAAEGKMYGVLLAEDTSGTRHTLRAFSGLLRGEAAPDGWVPMIPGREQVSVAEAQVLGQLESLKQALITGQASAEREALQALSAGFELRLQELSLRHAQHKEARAQQRQQLSAQLSGDALAQALESLDAQSRQEGIERKLLKRERDAALRPLQQLIQRAEDQSRALRQQRAALSRELQAQMHAHYWLTNFAGESVPLQQLMPGGAMPTGTGECCAPKLLHYAATHALTPLSMAEFWWGPPQGDRVQGELYGACAERCQPLMGFLLAGLTQRGAADSLMVLYEDQWLIAINKPAGLLSVPGRYHHNQDSVVSRLRLSRPEGAALCAAHRLDQDTSGVLLLARDRATHQHLYQQFAQRSVQKIYEAVLVGLVEAGEGVIALPLWGDPDNRPYQRVDWARGKPSETRFRVLSREANTTRVALTPTTGRTHQLRVHAASTQGLRAPILGDRLYGEQTPEMRLYLHARELRVTHPHSGQGLCLIAETPF